MVGDIFGDYGSASYDCAFAYGDAWHDNGFGSDPGFLFDADGFALDDPGVFEVVVDGEDGGIGAYHASVFYGDTAGAHDGEAMVDEAAFSYFHLAGEVELEGRQDGGGGGEYSLKEFIEALAHDGIEGRDGVCFPAEVHGPLYFIPCGPFIVFIGLHIDGFAVSKSCEDIFFHAFISLFSTMTKYWSRMDIFHVPSSLTRVST